MKFKILLKKNAVIFIAIFMIIFVFACVFVARALQNNVKLKQQYLQCVIYSCEKYGVRPELVLGMIKAESNFKSDAVSKRGAVGLMQLMPTTAEYIAKKINYNKKIRLTDVECNITLGTAYFAYLKGLFCYDKEALCAYNAGEGVVRKWLASEMYSKDGLTLDIVPYKQTADYLSKISKYEIEFKRVLEEKGYYEKKGQKRQFIYIFNRKTLAVYSRCYNVYDRCRKFSYRHILFYFRTKQGGRTVFGIFGKGALLHRAHMAYV